MNIIIAGNGKVGETLARLLSAEGHDLTMIDQNSRVIQSTTEQYDVMAVEGNCASMPVLLSAGVQNADLLICATSADEVNLLSCMTAHGINPKIHTIARIRNPEYTDQIYTMRHTFNLSLTVNPERQAAMEIVRMLKYPGFLRRDTFAKGRTEIVELRVDKNSLLKDVSLIDMYKIVKCKVLVCTVLRGGKAMAPNGSFVLREGDRIFVTASSTNLTVLLKNLGIITKRVRRVMLCGGSRISYYLVELLQKEGISVDIVEWDPKRCRDLAARFPGVNVLHGDCSDQVFLESEGIGDCDAVVPLTGMDEMNMIVSLYAASRGVGKVITKLGRYENIQLANGLNLGSVVCPRDLCSNNIVRYVRAMGAQTGAAISVHAIADGQAEAVEFLVDDHTPNCGKALKELKLKPNVLVVSITRGSHTEIPNGDSSFQRGDTVVVVTSGRGVLTQLSDIFA